MNKIWQGLRTGLGVGLVVGLGVVLWQRQNLYDWYRLRDYVPPARIVQLADSTAMNDYGRRLFYVHYPQLEDKVAFSNHCQGSEQTIVLGCYITNQAIYLFEVDDVRLAGVHEVTAAHEMLHAAYDRLDGSEKNKINALLEQFFSTIKDERLISTVAAYRDKDPGVVTNELHSILATEVRSLPPELETYYKKYFNDRQKIVGYSEQYEKAFTERKNRVAAFDAQLETLKQRIEESENNLSSSSAAVNAERDRLEALLSSGQTDAYNAGVAGFNQQIRSYNNLIASTKRLIEQYNQIVNDRNAVALEEQQLIEALDSRVAPQAEQ